MWNWGGIEHQSSGGNLVNGLFQSANEKEVRCGRAMKGEDGRRCGIGAGHGCV